MQAEKTVLSIMPARSVPLAQLSICPQYWKGSKLVILGVICIVVGDGVLFSKVHLQAGCLQGENACIMWLLRARQDCIIIADNCL